MRPGADRECVEAECRGLLGFACSCMCEGFAGEVDAAVAVEGRGQAVDRGPEAGGCGRVITERGEAVCPLDFDVGGAEELSPGVGVGLGPVENVVGAVVERQSGGFLAA